MPVALDQVKVGGEFGRRIQVTVENSLLNLDVDKDFLQPFREKKTKNGYTGLGMLIDCVRAVGRPYGRLPHPRTASTTW